ncbi:MAG: hypothetical protein UU81_C0041G0005 [Microgenomates group bacterium GW2011_GWC1_41_8]|uniref:Uncharacterized protein n=2 Tax=Candidatus Roizmaniibacteriota TaxID=1752723 RepID=A0A0G0WAM9_9BACT|nr:MAG: hypothetical protein UU14_C0008G0004 [Candidatus Roizmanbacteria bacterium GW2011_GWB1_40_7]KKR94260.1 MAG: hypothetical protein UU41_C0009G0006 [Candidatus Roizmanbacteria bacterium GW2011_GWA1_41_13]KKS23067.1 MAG: hypothetical protein UU81_C0041G0005 [Microgenomates group bacterium GW2011_GWC1_41_8]
MSKRKHINTNRLRVRLVRNLQRARKSFAQKHPHAVELLKNKGIEIGNLREHAKKVLASGLVAGSILLATPTINELPKDNLARFSELPLREREKMFSQSLKIHLVTDGYSLAPSQEKEISDIIQDQWGITAVPILEGKRLNHSYGMIGAEQHLPRYPGDAIYQHAELQQAGMTPGRGAWGYFVSSKNELTDEVIQKEKYYVAVQTLYLPDWNTNWVALKEWYKFRKVLVINPENGKSVVAVIGDAGPAKWTGKHFGGSPEVMERLDLYDGMRKGKVLLYFVNDPDDSVPLGPVGYN